MAKVTMREMLEAGVHFGHQTRYWNPKMANFIFGDRNKIHIINLEKTLPLYNDAMNYLGSLAAKKGTKVRDFKNGLVPFLVIVVPVCVLIAFEPDLSTACLVFLLAGIVLFTAGAKIGHFLVVAVVALPFAWQSIASAQYRLQRMVSFLSPGGDLAEESWQINQ